MFKSEKLQNGIQLITAHRADTQAVTVLVLVKVGSSYEPLELNGISHFIEHLLFKGTAQRPSSRQISRLLDGVGAEYNAFTGKDHTGYYVKAASEHLALALDVLSDMYFNSLFDAAEMDKERGVIVEEINMYSDNPLMLIGDVFERTVYNGHPLGRKISGPKEVIQKVSRDNLVRFYKDYYLTNQIIIGVAGNFDQKTLAKSVAAYFANNKVKTKTRNFQKFSIGQTAPCVNLHYKETEQVQLALGFPSFKNTDPCIYALSLLSVIMGGNMSSRLFTEIREKLGLAYFVKAGSESYEDTGTFIVQAGLELNSVSKAIVKILSELKKAVSSGVSAGELNRAKEFLKGKFVLQLEDSANLISWICEQKLLTGKIETPEEKLKKIMAVTLADIKKVARQVLDFSKTNLALIGPFKDQDKFLKLLN